MPRCISCLYLSQALPFWLQVDVITALPGLCADRDHAELSLQLIQTAESNPGAARASFALRKGSP
jgi:hypothetical protein